VAFLLLYMRMRRHRQETRIRERIGANIHDELGANLHAIGLLGDIAEESLANPNRLIETVRRIRSLTERTGGAARDCSNMLAAEGLCQDLVAEMKQDVSRFLNDLDSEICFDCEAALNELPRRLRIDIYLFHKECLANLIRHAGATKVRIQVGVYAAEVKLEVADNGRGLQGEVSKSLQRRARLSKGNVEFDESEMGGALVRLRVKRKQRRFLQ